MMKISEYRIAEQHGKWGFYGDIKIESRPLDESQVDVELDSADAQWTDSIRFAARYFLEHLSKIKGLYIKVLHLKTHDVDSTHVLVAFITVKALQHAHGMNEDTLASFDAEQKLFSFLK